jgi:hypothetical protein
VIRPLGGVLRSWVLREVGWGVSVVTVKTARIATSYVQCRPDALKGDVIWCWILRVEDKKYHLNPIEDSKDTMANLNARPDADDEEEEAAAAAAAEAFIPLDFDD